MARLTTHEMAYGIERIIEKRLRSAKVPRPKQLAIDITPEIIADIPTEAFEPEEPWTRGALFFHGDVEEDHVRDVQSEIERAHINIPKSRDLTLNFSTFGGDVFAGLALASTIQQVRRSGRRVNCHIQGCAMSMGSLIAQVADVRTIEPQGWFMLHEISTGGLSESLKTSLVRDEAEILDRFEEQMFLLYSARTGKPVKYYRDKMHRRDWYLTATEALAERLVDEISFVPPYARKRRTRP